MTKFVIYVENPVILNNVLKSEFVLQYEFFPKLGSDCIIKVQATILCEDQRLQCMIIKSH